MVVLLHIRHRTLGILVDTLDIQDGPTHQRSGRTVVGALLVQREAELLQLQFGAIDERVTPDPSLERGYYVRSRSRSA